MLINWPINFDVIYSHCMELRPLDPDNLSKKRLLGRILVVFFLAMVVFWSYFCDFFSVYLVTHSEILGIWIRSYFWLHLFVNELM